VEKNAKGIYVYSEADQMVVAGDVEEHAMEAREKGWDVTTLRETDISRAQHMIEDQETYWESVKTLWANSA